MNSFSHAGQWLRSGAVRLAAITCTPQMAHWRKSSYSGTAGNCVEVADLDGGGVQWVVRSPRCL
ncbi:MAG: DUF397 domain-containing protein [Candidatus Dormibacteria bacterium]